MNDTPLVDYLASDVGNWECLRGARFPRDYIVCVALCFREWKGDDVSAMTRDEYSAQLPNNISD